MGRFLRDDLSPKRSNLTLWIKILAAIGILLILERSIFAYKYLFVTPNHRKAIVAASIKVEDTSWIQNNFAKDWEINTYVADTEEADFTVYRNTGREANVYLTYIINHYWSLPDLIVFSHATRYQWHNDDPMFDGVVPIKNLKLDYIKSEGYVNLRCAWEPGCPTTVVSTSNATKGSDELFDFDRAFSDVYKELFPDHKATPETVGHQCCGQFAVTARQIRQHPPAYYERLRQWIWSTKEIPEFQAGRIIEHIWHIVFNKPPEHCQSAPECYCKLYGLCDLKCPDAPASCQGRFVVTPFWVQIDPNWPRKGQGKDGYPKNKWWQEFYPTDVYDGFKLRPNAALPSDAYRATAKPEPHRGSLKKTLKKPSSP